MKNSDFDIRELNNDVLISAQSIFNYRVGETNLVPLLYQTGYLTIKSYDKNDDAYTLGFPNEEVKYGFLNELLPAYVPKWGLDGRFYLRFRVQDGYKRHRRRSPCPDRQNRIHDPLHRRQPALGKSRRRTKYRSQRHRTMGEISMKKAMIKKNVRSFGIGDAGWSYPFGALIVFYSFF